MEGNITVIADDFAGNRFVNKGKVRGDVVDVPRLGDGQRFYLFEDFFMVGQDAAATGGWFIGGLVAAIPLAFMGLMSFAYSMPSIRVWAIGIVWAIIVSVITWLRTHRRKGPDVVGIDTEVGPEPSKEAYLKGGNEMFVVWDDQLPVAPYPLPVDKDGLQFWPHEPAVEAKRFIEQKKVVGHAVWTPNRQMTGQSGHDITWTFPWVMGGLFMLIVALGIVALVKSW